MNTRLGATGSSRVDFLRSSVRQIQRPNGSIWFIGILFFRVTCLVRHIARMPPSRFWANFGQIFGKMSKTGVSKRGFSSENETGYGCDFGRDELARHPLAFPAARHLANLPLVAMHLAGAVAGAPKQAVVPPLRVEQSRLVESLQLELVVDVGDEDGVVPPFEDASGSR